MSAARGGRPIATIAALATSTAAAASEGAQNPPLRSASHAATVGPTI